MPQAVTAGPLPAQQQQQQTPSSRARGLNLYPLQQPPHYVVMGQSSSSESKGLKRAGPYMRGAANHFGFKRKDKTGANNKTALEQRNYSPEALAQEQHNVTTSIKASSGLAKDGAPAPGAPAARTNRFGFKAPSTGGGAGRGLSNKVADSSAQVLAATKPPPAPVAAVVRSSCSPAGRGRAALRARPAPPTSLPVTRPGSGPGQPARAPGSMLPRPQFMARAKEAKTAANYGTRGLAPIATFDDELGSSKESSVNEDSGLGSQQTGDTDTLHGVDILDVSPRSGQRLRMRRPQTGVARRSLRDVRDEEDDPNVITEIVPIAKMVSRASLRSIASLGGTTNMPSPRQLSAKSSVKSASSDEFHSDSGLFRDYGEGLDDGNEAKVFIDCKMAEKRLAGRCMKDYGPGEEQDEDWGQGEAMAESDWREEVGAVVIDEEPASEVRELQSSLRNVEAGTNLAELVAAAAAAEHGLIEDESAPEDSLFSSSSPSTSEDSPAKHSRSPQRSPRRKVRTRRRERDAKEGKSALADSAAETKDSLKKSEKSAFGAKNEVHALSPEGSGTPSNSFSLSDGRDFLIDDEITDQPALTLHRSVRGHGDDSEMASLAESAASVTLREASHHQAHAHSRALRASGADGGSLRGSPSVADHQRSHRSQLSRDNTMRLARFGSMDSLATNSIDSEDLMMDFEEDVESGICLTGTQHRSITKSWGGSPVMFWPRPRRTRSFSFVDLDHLKSVGALDGAEAARAKAARARSRSCGGDGNDLREELVQENGGQSAGNGGGVLLELSSLIESVHGKQSVAGRHPQTRASAQAGSCPNSAQGSAPDSPRFSFGSSGAPSPLRPPRQLASSDSDESAMMRVDRGTYQHMYQDVVHIKTMLLKLKRVLQEAETINPFESSLKNGLLHQLVHADESSEDLEGKSRNPEEEVVDLKRQMVLMKQQMEEKDRTIQLMQVQMMKYERVADEPGENGQPADMCNAATQTERIRPVSAGPSILHSLPSDSNGTPLVSWTDSWGRRSRTPASGISNPGSSNIENRTSSTSRVPTPTSRSSRSVIPGHQRLSIGSVGDSPSSIPLVKGNHRKTGTAIDSVPNSRRPPMVAVSRKAMGSGTQKP